MGQDRRPLPLFDGDFRPFKERASSDPPGDAVREYLLSLPDHLSEAEFRAAALAVLRMIDRRTKESV